MDTLDFTDVSPPLQRARILKEKYESMRPWESVPRADVYSQLNSIAEMAPENEQMQSENRELWQLMVYSNSEHPKGKFASAKVAYLAFACVELWCVEQITHKEMTINGVTKTVHDWFYQECNEKKNRGELCDCDALR